MTHSYRQSLSFRHRFAIFFKGRMGGLLDSLEDPERSLHQVVLDMEQQLEAAKRAASRAVANERRLRDKVARLRRDAEEFDHGARRTLAKGHEADAREYLDRAERARRQANDLEQQLETQAEDTARVRRSVKRLHERLDEARARLAAAEAGASRAKAALATGDANLSVARAAVLEAEARLPVQRAARDQAAATLEKTIVRAPFDAIVQSENVDIGQLVGPSGPVATLIGTETFWVRVSIPIEQLAWLRFPEGEAEGSPPAWCKPWATARRSFARAASSGCSATSIP